MTSIRRRGPKIIRRGDGEDGWERVHPTPSLRSSPPAFLVSLFDVQLSDSISFSAFDLGPSHLAGRLFF